MTKYQSNLKELQQRGIYIDMDEAHPDYLEDHDEDPPIFLDTEQLSEMVIDKDPEVLEEANDWQEHNQKQTPYEFTRFPEFE